MGTASFLDEPFVPPSLDPTNVATPSIASSKSRIKSMFHRRKVSTGSLVSVAKDGHDEKPSAFHSLYRSKSRPDLGRRSRSSHSPDFPRERPRTSERKIVSRREKTVSDPPPLAQVYGQAILHASLEVPLSFHGRDTTRRSNATKSSSPTELLQESVEVKRSHRRTDSGLSTCSVKDKMFFLINGPYIMQYDGDASGDALPEKIMILDRNSIVFASDVVPGRHWVLQISKRRNSSGGSKSPHRGQSSSAWSRLAFRSAEERRLVDTLLLIFNDSEDMCTWLFAIRKEIENLGGEESRPETREDDRAWKDHLTGSFAPPPDVDATSLHSTSMQLRSPITSPVVSVALSSRSARAIGRAASVRSSTSSKKTRTSLDRLRDSMTSDGYSSTIATSSAGSAPSSSPTQCNFPSITTVADTANVDFAVRSRSLNSSRQSKTVTQARGILERRKQSIGSLQTTEIPNNRPVLPDLPAVKSSSPKNLSPKLPPSNWNQSQEEEADKTANDNSPQQSTEPRISLHTEATDSVSPLRKPSIREANGTPSKPKYSLFPTCPPVPPKPEPLADPLTVEPLSQSAKEEVGKISVKDHLAPPTEAQHRKTRSRTLTLNARDIRVSTFLTPGSIHAPQRSPAVTSEMITMNFGASSVDIPPSPIGPIKVPGLMDMKFDLDFLKQPYQQPTRKISQTERKRIQTAKSMSNIHIEGNSAVARAPLGPPPAGPLPAVPTDSRRSSSTTNRSSQWSQNSQWSQGSRKSGTQSDVSSIRVSTELKDVTTQPRYLSVVTGSPERQNRHKRAISNTIIESPIDNERLGVCRQWQSLTYSRSRSQEPPQLESRS